MVVDQTRLLLGSLRSAVLEPFLEEWPDKQPSSLAHPTPASLPTPGRASPSGRAPGSLPVLRWLPEVEAGAPAFSIAVVGDLCRIAPQMVWRQTYLLPDVDAQFLENYAWCEILGLNGEVVRTRIACGFLLLGPGTHYPQHRHEAEEVYVPLSGIASWQQGDGVWRDQQPGTVIHHVSGEPHAMRTTRQPLLALYLWRSDNLNQKAHLCDHRP